MLLLKELKKILTSPKANHLPTSACFCPKCDNNLTTSSSYVSSESYGPDADTVMYKCTSCNEISHFIFGVFPVPVLFDELQERLTAATNKAKESLQKRLQWVKENPLEATARIIELEKQLKEKRDFYDTKSSN